MYLGNHRKNHSTDQCDNSRRYQCCPEAVPIDFLVSSPQIIIEQENSCCMRHRVQTSCRNGDQTMHNLHIRTSREEILRHTGEHKPCAAGGGACHCSQHCRSYNCKHIRTHLPRSNIFYNSAICCRTLYNRAKATDSSKASDRGNTVVQACKDFADIHTHEPLQVQQIAAKCTQQHSADGKHCRIADKFAANKDKQNQDNHR